jgi:hypothetical protein
MAMLLGSRGRGRSRGGLGKSLRTVVGSLFGRSEWRPEPAAKARVLPMWVAGFAAVVGIAGGYFLGTQTGGGLPPALAGLKAPAPRTPSFVGEVDATPLARQAFLVTLYPGVAEADAKANAARFSAWLVGQGVKKARPYLAKLGAGPTWGVAVYFDGDAEQTATRNQLTQLPGEVPDAGFVELRNTIQGWPKAYTVR